MRCLINTCRCYLARISAALLVLTPAVLAHDPGLSSARAEVHHDEIRVFLAFSNADVAALLSGVDGDRDGRLSEVELATAKTTVLRLILDGGRLTVGTRLLVPASSTVSLGENQDVCVTLRYRKPLEPRAGGSADGGAGESAEGWLSWRLVLLDRLPRGHRHYVAIVDTAGRCLGQALLHRAQPAAMAELDRLPPARVAALQQGWNFLVLGVEHILIGYDHILFLLALLIMGGTLRAAIAIITSFTVAHSLTLAAASLNLVRLPGAMVEAVIALSIVWVGLQNLRRAEQAHRWRITFLFGLVHGFGFASVLRDLGIGSEQGVVLPLLAFNVGVEIGQIAIAALALPLAWWLTSRRIGPRIVFLSSVAITLMGAWWLLERTLLA